MQKTIGELELLVKKYEENGPAKLFYSVRRKSWEIAELLNSVNLEGLTLDDAKDKTFDRLKGLLKDASDIALTVKTLGDIGGVTEDEEKDIKRTIKTTPEKMAGI